jgi:hypothetical protein
MRRKAKTGEEKGGDGNGQSVRTGKARDLVCMSEAESERRDEL